MLKGRVESVFRGEDWKDVVFILESFGVFLDHQIFLN
jgi:hypothetical protein